MPSWPLMSTSNGTAGIGLNFFAMTDSRMRHRFTTKTLNLDYCVCATSDVGATGDGLGDHALRRTHWTWPPKCFACSLEVGLKLLSLVVAEKAIGIAFPDVPRDLV